MCVCVSLLLMVIRDIRKGEILSHTNRRYYISLHRCRGIFCGNCSLSLSHDNPVCIQLHNVESERGQHAYIGHCHCCIRATSAPNRCQFLSLTHCAVIRDENCEEIFQQLFAAASLSLSLSLSLLYAN
jgi:hypothetical protein